LRGNVRLSVFDMFKVGIGPSSSHTVGPMNAARRFAEALASMEVAKVAVELFGSLGHTGKGHGTDVAVQLGLEGETPDATDVDQVATRVARIAADGKLRLLGTRPVSFRVSESIVFHRKKSLPLHSNGMRFIASDAAGNVLLEKIYYSVGGGFVIGEGETDEAKATLAALPHPFKSGAELLALCKAHGLSVSTLVLENETAMRPEADVRAGVLRLGEANAKASSPAASR
jgi:L-serine dehydratase